MVTFLLGLIALIVFLILARGMNSPSAATYVRALYIFGGVAALSASAVFLFGRALTYAVPFATLGLWLLSRAMGPPTSSYHGGAEDGRFSSVVTDHLEMELNLDTGDLQGQVRKGRFAGARIEQMSPEQLAALWQECRFTDPQSSQLLEAYLDRIHPTWREDMSRAEHGGGPTGSGRMTLDEAYEILGLERSATLADVRRAHKELMLKVHPDRGGSSYLASKINEAKDIVLAHKQSGDA